MPCSPHTLLLSTSSPPPSAPTSTSSAAPSSTPAPSPSTAPSPLPPPSASTSPPSPGPGRPHDLAAGASLAPRILTVAGTRILVAGGGSKARHVRGGRGPG
ncbi:hypothetical protein Sjap_008316 [Stephania japonica]|uniref:Uncharacterized protein n=1 Tax=Stephania japonica TaxID=461633 RepID=A0AAP0PB82_9MAGN